VWIESLAGGDHVTNPMALAGVLAGIVVIVHFFESLAQWLHELAFKRLAQRVQHDLRTDVYDHIQVGFSVHQLFISC
jgi:ATP-binding cassette subfamily B protein